MISLAARRFGIRKLSDDGTTLLVRFPRWLVGERLDERLREIETEARLVRRPVRVERAGRFAKITRLGWTRRVARVDQGADLHPHAHVHVDGNEIERSLLRDVSRAQGGCGGPI